MFTIKPVEIATTKMAITNDTTNSFLNNLDNNTTSGILAPAPPIINETTVPKDIPFEANAPAIGNIVSGLIYIGIPTTDAMSTDILLSPLAYLVINVSGTNPYIKAPINTPINKEALDIRMPKHHLMHV